jgi:2-C-methyl-D-erythritol 4-phosphate cytidylyltransferase / 2-C-methyl-D-erythritol 2,4-cyclodiphosphate synthase
MPAEFVAVLVAAGRSTRMGTDKLWADLWGRPTWRWAFDALAAADGLRRIAVSVPDDAIDRFRAALPPEALDRCDVVAGGEERADSVLAGLRALRRAGHDDETLTLVHDAARPGVTTELVTAVAELAASVPTDAVVPVIAVPDSLKRVRAGRVVAPVDREEVAAAQTPQAASLGTLRAAIEEARAWNRPVTDDAGALAAAGVSVRVVPGDPRNRKVTEPSDLDAVRGMLAASSTPITAPGSSTALPGVRCGIGFDAHRLVAGREMRIGGVVFADEPRGPDGHSDGDAALHALIDALLGAAQLGDVGALFPPGEATWEGADSRDLVRRAVARLREHGWRATAADVAVAVASPAIGPRREEIIEAIAGLLGVGLDAVSIKGTTSDGLGFAGAEGIAAWAVAGVARLE